MNFTDKTIDISHFFSTTGKATLQNSLMRCLFYTNAAKRNGAYLYMRTFLEIRAHYPYYYNFKPLEGYCILYTKEGEGILTVNDTDIHLTPQSLYFWPCTAPYTMKIVSTQWNCFQLFIDGTEASYYHALFSEFSSGSIDIPRSSKIPNLICRLESRSEMHLESHLHHISFLTNFLIEVAALSQKQNNSPKIPNYLVRIKNRFDEHYEEYYSLDMLEEQVQINKYRIVREFSHYFGISPISYLAERRMEAAKNLLTATDYKVHDIGRQVGYENTTHFINTFKKHVGVTPLNYRKEYSQS